MLKRGNTQMRRFNSLMLHAVLQCVCTEATMCRTKMDLQLTCSNCCYGTPMSTYSNIQSVISCSQLCSGNLDCRSFLYKSNSLECRTNAEKLVTVNTSCTDLARYGEISKATCRPHWLFEPCNSHDDCLIANSTCIDNRCECRDGYPYDYRSDSCPAGCIHYGFTLHEVQYYIKGHDRITVTGLSKADCQALCFSVTKFVCRFIEYGHHNGKCFLSEANALNNPEDVRYAGNTVFRQWDRNCA